MLYFIEKLSTQLLEVKAIGGTSVADAMIKHQNGMIIYAEIKSAPLITYPLLFDVPESCLRGHHKKIEISKTQLDNSNSALFIHRVGTIDLGKVNSPLWPFKSLVQFIIKPENIDFVQRCIKEWLIAKKAYIAKNQELKLYYVTNACGKPPRNKGNHENWQQRESISDR